jgi:enoyl-CoA hydratase/carnithine racemase
VSVIITRREGFLFLHLENPKGNSLTPKVAREIASAVREAGGDTELHGIQLSGEGKHFCTGADLGWLVSCPDEGFEAFRELYEALHACDLPLLGNLQGKVYGGGFGLALACDIAAAECGTGFALPELRWGLVPGVLTPFAISRMGAGRFRYLSLTGQEVSATVAQEWGLVHFVGEPDECSAFLAKTRAQLADQPREALLALKRSSRACEPLDFRELEKISSERKNSAEAQLRLKAFKGARDEVR